MMGLTIGKAAREVGAGDSRSRNGELRQWLIGRPIMLRIDLLS